MQVEMMRAALHEAIDQIIDGRRDAIGAEYGSLGRRHRGRGG